MKRALKFWTDTLGFAGTFTSGDPVCSAILNRDGVDMHIGLDSGAAGYGHCHMPSTRSIRFTNPASPPGSR